jgi:hypothetical protein
MPTVEYENHTLTAAAQAYQQLPVAASSPVILALAGSAVLLFPSDALPPPACTSL